MKKVYLTHRALYSLYKEFRANNIPFRIAKRGINNSIFSIPQQIKYINEDATKELPNPITGEIDKFLSGEYVKLCLKSIYPTFNQKTLYSLFDVSAPMWYCGQFFNQEMVYIDIKACYYQLYKRLWLDLTEPLARPPKQIPLKSLAEQLYFWKAARNSVLGYLASNSICIVRGQKWQYINVQQSKDFFNPNILGIVNLMLHEIATNALKFGACYVNTDGYMFPKKVKYIDFMRYLDRLGLDYRAIIGRGSIIRFGAYSIQGEALRGDEIEKGTKNYDKIVQNHLDNIITDIQVKKLESGLHFPVKKIDYRQNDDIIKWWSKLN
jgi:hypothetical protein